MLRILAISDIHGRKDAVKALIRDVKNKKLEIDCILIAGDIGCPEDPRRFSQILEILRKKLGVDIYYVKGNWDVTSYFPRTSGIYDLDETGPIKVGNFLIVGHGEKYEKYDVKANPKRVILLSHYPPYGILDRGFKYSPYRRGSHTGLMLLNYLIEEYKPILHFFGHAHKSGGLTLKLNGVWYVNTARLDRFTHEGKCIGNYTLAIVDTSSPPKIKHYYINGIAKMCARCGRKVLMPPSWNVCKRCMMREELEVSRIVDPGKEKYIEIEIHTTNGSNTKEKLPVTSKSEPSFIPLSTIRNKNVLREFLEDLIREKIFTQLSKNGKRVLSLSKETLPYAYPCPLNPETNTFIVRLFKCKYCSNEHITASCLVFKTILEYKSEVLWTMKPKNEGGDWSHEQYMVIFKSQEKSVNKDLIRNLINNGFNVILVSFPDDLLRREED